VAPDRALGRGRTHPAVDRDVPGERLRGAREPHRTSDDALVPRTLFQIVFLAATIAVVVQNRDAQED
jgi:hypothetical protein